MTSCEPARTMMRTTLPAASRSRLMSSGRAILDSLGIPRAPFALLRDDQRPGALTLRVEVRKDHARDGKPRSGNHDDLGLPRLLGDPLRGDDFEPLRLRCLLAHLGGHL